MNGWMDAWMDGWMDEWMDEWMNGWVDGKSKYAAYLKKMVLLLHVCSVCGGL